MNPGEITLYHTELADVSFDVICYKDIDYCLICDA